MYEEADAALNQRIETEGFNATTIINQALQVYAGVMHLAESGGEHIVQLQLTPSSPITELRIRQVSDFTLWPGSNSWPYLIATPPLAAGRPRAARWPVTYRRS